MSRGQAVFTVARCLGVVALCGLTLFVTQPFGDRLPTFLAVLLVFALGLLRRRFRGTGSRLEEKAIPGIPLIWMGLIAWSEVSPGGERPPPKTDPAAIRVVSWNILVGSERGAFWNRHDWSTRKPALASAIKDAAPDVLCVQEALEEQAKFIESRLPRHRRVGVGRDDGKSGGEFCAIYFDADRFERLSDGTFWLEPPFDQPPRGPRIGPKRICSWVRLRDRDTDRIIRIYNTHLYLTERYRTPAVREILARIEQGDATDSIAVAGDYNAAPGSVTRRLLSDAGFRPAAEIFGGPAGRRTYQFFGIRTRSLNEFHVGRGWRPIRYRILDVKPGNTYPSDHFGVLADFVLDREKPMSEKSPTPR